MTRKEFKVGTRVRVVKEKIAHNYQANEVSNGDEGKVTGERHAGGCSQLVLMDKFVNGAPLIYYLPVSCMEMA